MGGKKPKRQQISKRKTQLRPDTGKLDTNNLLTFSFKHVELNHKKFNLVNYNWGTDKKPTANEYIHTVYERLKDLCTYTGNELRSQAGRDSPLKFHVIDFKGTTMPDYTPEEGEL